VDKSHFHNNVCRFPAPVLTQLTLMNSLVKQNTFHGAMAFIKMTLTGMTHDTYWNAVLWFLYFSEAECLGLYNVVLSVLCLRTIMIIVI